MKKRLRKVLVPLIVLLLVVCLALAVSARDVHAEPDQVRSASYPSPGMVYLDYSPNGLSFTNTKLYYRNGDLDRGQLTGTASDYNAYYDYSSGTLYLKNYNGPTIGVADGEGETLKIVAMAGTSNIINGNKYGIIAPNIDLKIDGGQSSSISVTVENDDDWWPIIGIATYTWADEMDTETTGIEILGNVDLKINVVSSQNGNGIVSYDSVKVKDHAKLDVDVRTVSEYLSFFSSNERQYKYYNNSAVHIRSGKMILETDQIVDVKMFDTGNWSKTYCYAYTFNNGLGVDVSSGNCPAASFAMELAWDALPVRCDVLSFNPTSQSGYTIKSTHSGTIANSVIYLNNEADLPGLPIIGGFFIDPGFRLFVQDQFDCGSKGYLDDDDIADADEIYLSMSNVYDQVYNAYSLKGIEYLTSLQYLTWADGDLFDKVDLSRNKDLLYVDLCNNPRLTGIRTYELTALEELYCDDCENAEIALYGNSGLKILHIKNNIATERMDLSAATVLEEIDCSTSSLQGLSLFSPVLKKINCTNCLNLPGLNLTNLTGLEELYCGNSGISSLDLSKNTNLKRLNCSECGMDSLDVSKNLDLRQCICWGNGITDLNLGALHNLEYLSCYGNQIETLDIGLCDLILYAYTEGSSEDLGYHVMYTKMNRFRLDIDKETEVLRSVMLKAANLTLEGRISINIKVDAPSLEYVAKLYYEKNGFGLVKEIPLLHDDHHSDSTGGYYLVTYDQIPAKEMTEKLRIKVFDKNGNQIKLRTSQRYIDEYDYSVATWCNNRISNSTDEKEIFLAKALLNYGRYSQLALKYKDGREGRPDTMPNSQGYLYDEMDEVTANPAYSSVINNGTQLGAKAFALVLESNTSIKLKLKRQVNVKINGVSAALHPETDGDGSAIWAVYKDNIAAKQLHEKQTFLLTEGSNTATMQYGALSWANSKLNGSNLDEKNLAKAMYIYNNAARIYFNYDTAGL